MESQQLNIKTILSLLGDEKAFMILHRVASGRLECNELRGQSSELTKSQYYSKLSGLVDAGLVARVDTTYSLTAFGKIVHNAIAQIDSAINYESKLKEASRAETSGNMFTEQQRKSAIESVWEDWVAAVIPPHERSKQQK